MLRSSAGLLPGWAAQFRVLRAVMLRDMVLRHGRDNVGFVWLILEPMILTLGVMIVWSVIMGREKDGLMLVDFVLTGYMPLTLWRHITNTAASLFRNSSTLLYHRRITPFDIFFSKFFLEFIATSAALLVVWGTLNALGIVAEFNRLDLILLGWIMMGSLAGGVALITAYLTERFEVSEKFIQPFQYLLLPVSGFFALVDWLPDWAGRALLFNPMVHCFEAFRGGFFGDSIVTHFSPGYVGAWVFACFFFGLIGLGRVRDHIRLQ